MTTHAALSAACRPVPPGTLVIALDGEADMDTASVLAHVLREALDAPLPETVVVDCSRLTFCASAGLNELLRTRRTATEAGTAFGLAAPSRQLTRLLEITGADSVFEVLPSAPLAYEETPLVYEETPLAYEESGEGPGRTPVAGGRAAEAVRRRYAPTGRSPHRARQRPGPRRSVGTVRRGVGSCRCDCRPPRGGGRPRRRTAGADGDRASGAVARGHSGSRDLLVPYPGRPAWFLARAATALTPVLD
ncbi:STAS domain-containing protein [Streptomyces sp. NPDC093089]|uniref:STAS domain-containing protein n=1 Tax=Streptomyces sp. NPDC093089 TaxID=3366024 RepID=UPI0038225DA0